MRPTANKANVPGSGTDETRRVIVSMLNVVVVLGAWVQEFPPHDQYTSEYVR